MMMMMMMQEPKDPAIKLFGKEIPLSSSSSDTTSVEKEDWDEEPADETETKKRSSVETSETTRRSSIIDASLDSVTMEAAAVDQGGTTKPKSSKTMKKPDKVLPCPRCNSTNTKFCYYNNYNVHQPRHFCRSCQRYWTAGGNMRTMLVGAGRRKTKSTSSHYRHISISEELRAVETDAAANGIRRPVLKYHDGTVLNFGGIDPPILDSTASILNGTDKKALNGLTSGPKSGKRRFTNSNGEDGDNRSGDSTVSALNSNNEGTANINFHPHIPGIPGIPWPYPWNYLAVLPPSTPCPAGFSTPFYHPTFLNCSFLSNWNLPSLVPSHGVPDSPAGELLDSENPTKRRNASVLVPKTLRVDDPKEAAKSTIWSTLGIEKDSLYRECFLKAQSAGKISPVLVSNPPSLSRSVGFVESSST
ncbi:hypothetical protein MLD38_039384 [Melastoma candidum]|uniref:Uncharacterized protein n=1 Tax=Melastoma candidum TaxID=119954 RepID=A0ACB9L1W6_9MYRT|nr:hypothetical protein MLD38_039384 [Melastoma candidum]